MISENKSFDVVIVGGSYAGLSAAMALGRAIRKVLIIDSGKPCNMQTPHSHNLITQDGKTPAEISAEAKKQVLAYPTVTWLDDKAVAVTGADQNFVISTEKEDEFHARKLLFTTGVKDLLLPVPGLAESWGISVIHCPYCHGYEYRGQVTGILINGEMALEFGKLIKNWTSDVTIFTNGPATFDATTWDKIVAADIKINEKKISKVVHENGYIKSLVLEDESRHTMSALYAKLPFDQHCQLPIELGCTLTAHGHIQVDESQKTTIPGIYAAGDNTTMFRALSIALAGGTTAGARINHELISEGH